VDFLRRFRHNERTSLVKGCVFVNTTLPLFSEQSREVFYFSGCGFRKREIKGSFSKNGLKFAGISLLQEFQRKGVFL